MANIKQNTVIDGAVITPEIIETLIYWQNDDNACLQGDMNALADVLAYIALNIYNDSTEMDIKKAILYDLSQLRRLISKFKKP